MWQYSSPGIPDDRFNRGRVPMTKEEVRVITIAKARLRPDSMVYDIGAGTGSLSVEAALLTPKGRVYAVERDETGVTLIKENCRIFGVDNVQVIHGEAPDAMAGLPLANCILLGGSGGYLRDIIFRAKECLHDGGRIVINAVTLETLNAAQTSLHDAGFVDMEIVSLAVTRWPVVGRSHMASALNTVFVISATK